MKALTAFQLITEIEKLVNPKIKRKVISALLNLNYIKETPRHIYSTTKIVNRKDLTNIAKEIEFTVNK